LLPLFPLSLPRARSLGIAVKLASDDSRPHRQTGLRLAYEKPRAPRVARGQGVGDRDGRFFVNTDGPDGRLADFEIRDTFGVEPLQRS
jgi:hypothetical protein